MSYASPFSIAIVGITPEGSTQAKGATAEGRRSIPQKYWNHGSSRLKVTVEQKDNFYEFKLKS